MTEGPLVALETSGPVGSLAVGRHGEVGGRVFLAGTSAHASRLIPALGQLLGEVGLARGDLAGVVVGSGPGSFTGLRVAAASAKGLVHALAVPLWAVSSLEAAAVADRVLSDIDGPWERSREVEGAPAEAVAGRSEPRYVLFDARGDRVYAACYRVGSTGLEVLHPPRAARIDAVLAGPRTRGLSFVGTGAFRHRAAIEAAGGSVLPPPAGLPTADGLLHVLALRPGVEPVDDPRGWEPDYLRASGAERARQR